MEENIKLKNDLLFEKAIALAEDNDFDEAIRCCDEMISNDASDVDAWEIKAICYFAKNDFVESLNCDEKVIELKPNDDLAKICKKNCLAVLENDEMLEILKKLENLHKIGVLTSDEYSAMRKLAFNDFYKNIHNH